MVSCYRDQIKQSRLNVCHESHVLIAKRGKWHILLVNSRRRHVTANSLSMFPTKNFAYNYIYTRNTTSSVYYMSWLSFSVNLAVFANDFRHTSAISAICLLLWTNERYPDYPWCTVLSKRSLPQVFNISPPFVKVQQFTRYPNGDECNSL